MARTNNLHLHIPDLSPPKLHRPRILRGRVAPGEIVPEEKPRHELPEVPGRRLSSEVPDYPALHELPVSPASLEAPAHDLVPSRPGSPKSLASRTHELPKVPKREKVAPIKTEQQSSGSSTTIVSPTHVLMFLAGILVARLHVLLVVFCILGLLVLAAIRNDTPSQDIETPPSPQKRGHKVVRHKPRQPLRLEAVNSIDEKFAYRPYG